MSNKEKSQATITELMTRNAAIKGSGSVYFNKPDVKNKSTDLEDGSNRVVKIKRRLQELNMLVPGSSLDAGYSDEYRRIKRPLLSNAFGKTAQLVENGNLILVTSSIPGEGKTHTAVNLALSIAQERDHTVLLVDCDVTRHGSSKLLSVSDKPGLIDILESDSFTVGDAILRTDVPELCVVSAGKQHEYLTELLASQRMRELVEEIGARYDDRVVVFDAPPLLSTPQAQVLTDLVGQVVFVIEAGKTPQLIVKEALSMISKEQATGLVMNKSEGLSCRSGYYYGYYDAE